MAGHTSHDIREATGTSNAPGDCTDDSSSSDQWATRVSHASTLTVLGEDADGAGNNQWAVVGSVASLAISVGDCAGVQEHQVSGSTAGMLLDKGRRLGLVRFWMMLSF